MSFPNPSIPLQAGDFVYSVPVPIYTGFTLSHGFTLTAQVTSPQILVYGHVQGAPSASLQAQIMQGSTVVASASVPPSAFSGGADRWQLTPFQFPGVVLLPGRYTVLLFCSGGNAANAYQVWFVADILSDGQAIYTNSSGGSVVWVKDALGNTVALYPFEALNDGHLGPIFPQTVTAPVSYSSQGVVLFIGDRHWDQTTSSVTVTDASTGALLATGALDQNLVAGRQGMVPISLDQKVNFIQGKQYRINGPSGNITWAIPIRGTYLDPPPSTLIYRLPQSQFVPMFSDLCTPLLDTTGQDAISSTISSGVLFSPTKNGTLTEFHLLMKGFGAAGNYAAGDTLTVSVFANAPQGGAPFNQPTGIPLAQASLPSTQVPKFGFADFTGLSLPVTALVKYWAALSLNASSVQKMYQARLINPYRFEVLRTYPGQVPLWNYDGEGPTDWSFRVVTSAEEIGNFITDIPYLTASATSGAIAQPFIAPSSMSINGVSFGGGFKLGGPWNSYVLTSIFADSGANSPSGPALGSGKFRVAEQTWPGTEYVGFDTAAPVTGGQKYWVVVSPSSGLTVMGVVAIVYYRQPSGWPAGLNALVDKTGGGNYSAVVGPGTSYPTSVAAIVPFWLAAQIGATSTIPTTVTVTAKAH